MGAAKTISGSWLCDAVRFTANLPSLFCESTRFPDRVDIALGTMHEPVDREPQLHTYFDSRASWITVGDDLPRLGGKTGFEPLQDPATPEEIG